jgi:two-component system, sensor histidine kinase and response regulator
MSDDPVLDPGALDRLLEVVGGDEAFVDDLLATFVEDAVTQLRAMSDAAAAGAASDMLRPAHSLKSNSANVGALRLSELARALEVDARAGFVDDAVARVRGAESEFEAVRQALSAARGR